MWAALVTVALLCQVTVRTCELVELRPPVVGALPLTFPPVETKETKDGSFVTVFQQPGVYLVYWIYVADGKIGWQLERITVQGQGPSPQPQPQPGPQPGPQPAPARVSVLWLEESSLRTPKLAQLVTSLRDAVRKMGLDFGAVDVDNTASFIRALVGEIRRQVPSYDPKKGPLLVLIVPGTSQVVACAYVGENNTVEQLVQWIVERSRASAKNSQVDHRGSGSNYRSYSSTGRTTEPVFCPIPGACPTSP